MDLHNRAMTPTKNEKPNKYEFKVVQKSFWQGTH